MIILILCIFAQTCNGALEPYVDSSEKIIKVSNGAWEDVSLNTVQGPIGTIAIWPTNSITWDETILPDGWTFCYGQSLSDVKYLALATLLGSTTAPDMRNHLVAGVKDGQTLNSKIGSNTQTIKIENMPKHAHAITHVPNFYPLPHGSYTNLGDGTRVRFQSSLGDYCMIDPDNSVVDANSYVQIPENTNDFPSTDTQSFNVRQPFRILNYIIKYK